MSYNSEMSVINYVSKYIGYTFYFEINSTSHLLLKVLMVSKVIC